MPQRACMTDTCVDDEGQIVSGDRVPTTANDKDDQPSTVRVRGCGVTTTTDTDNTDDEKVSLPACGQGSKGHSRSRTARSSSPSIEAVVEDEVVEGDEAIPCIKQRPQSHVSSGIVIRMGSCGCTMPSSAP